MSNSPKPSDFPQRPTRYLDHTRYLIDLNEPPSDWKRLPNIDVDGKTYAAFTFQYERYSSYSHHTDGTYGVIVNLDGWVKVSGKLRSLDPFTIY